MKRYDTENCLRDLSTFVAMVKDQFKLSEVGFVKKNDANNKNKREIDIDRCSTSESHSSEVKHRIEHFLRSRGREMFPHKSFQIQGCADKRSYCVQLSRQSALFSHARPKLHTAAAPLQNLPTANKAGNNPQMHAPKTIVGL